MIRSDRRGYAASRPLWFVPDVSDEGSSDVTERCDDHLRIRLRPAAADRKKPPPSSPPAGGDLGPASQPGPAGVSVNHVMEEVRDSDGGEEVRCR